MIGAKLSCQYENKVVQNAIILLLKLQNEHKIKEFWTCKKHKLSEILWGNCRNNMQY